MLSNGCVAVDIGKKNIKIVHGRVIGQKIELLNFDIIKTPENSIKDGKIVELSPIINSLRVSFKSKKIMAKNLKLIISGTNIITRNITIPKVNENEIESMLEFEAPQYFPVSLEDYVLDYKIMEEIIENENVLYRLLLVAVPNNQVNEYMQIPKILRMNIESIDISANSIYKYMLYSKKNDKSIDEMSEFAVIDFGAHTTGICIFSKGTLLFNRVLLRGGREIDETISMTMNIDYDISENLKCKTLELIENEDDRSSFDNDILQLNDIVKPAIMNQADDINKFLEFYYSRTYANKINKIYLCGGGSKLRGLDKFLSSYLGIPVERVKHENRVINKHKRYKDNFEDSFPYLLNALGTIF